MTEHFNGLTPAEAERLACLAEEAAEVVQMVGKILRHGYENYHPADMKRTPNRELLAREVSDFFGVAEAMMTRGDLDRMTVEDGAVGKSSGFAPGVGAIYLHHQEEE